MQKWEYATLLIDTPKRIYSLNGKESLLDEKMSVHALWNQLGLQGWEMVTTDFARSGWGVSVSIFKRLCQGE